MFRMSCMCALTLHRPRGTSRLRCTPLYIPMPVTPASTSLRRRAPSLDPSWAPGRTDFDADMGIEPASQAYGANDVYLPPTTPSWQSNSIECALLTHLQSPLANVEELVRCVQASCDCAAWRLPVYLWVALRAPDSVLPLPALSGEGIA